jgi:cytochrome c553
MRYKQCFDCSALTQRSTFLTTTEKTMASVKHWLTASAVLAASVGAHAQVNQVAVWAAACATCHGTNGHAEPGNVTLAGANKDEMTKVLLSYKAGTRPATIMHQLTKGYTDEQLTQISAYFAAQKK